HSSSLACSLLKPHQMKTVQPRFSPLLTSLIHILHKHSSISQRVAWLISHYAHKCHSPFSMILPSSLAIPSHVFSQGSRRTVLHCAHRTSTISSCAFREQEDD